MADLLLSLSVCVVSLLLILNKALKKKWCHTFPWWLAKIELRKWLNEKMMNKSQSLWTQRELFLPNVFCLVEWPQTFDPLEYVSIFRMCLTDTLHHHGCSLWLNTGRSCKRGSTFYVKNSNSLQTVSIPLERDGHSYMQSGLSTKQILWSLFSHRN